MPTIAGTRMPFLPCLETPNKATMPETKPTAMSKSANSTKIGIIFRATICRSNIKSAKTMRLMTGQTQPSLAARCENDVVFGVVGASIFGCGLTKKAEPPPTRDVNRDSGTDSANGGWLRRLVRPRHRLLNKAHKITLPQIRRLRTCPPREPVRAKTIQTVCDLLISNRTNRTFRQPK